MLQKNVGIISLAILIGVLLFYSPQLDQWLALIPFNKNSHQFYGEISIVCKLIYYAVPWITSLLIILPFLNWVFNHYIGITTLFEARKLFVVMLVALLIGPGLLVNVMFKDNWGRPRPYQVLRDGMTYAPFWQPSFYAVKDNSFPSGHASIGFFLGVPFLARGYRKRGFIVSCLGGGAVGAVRIMQGGHYLSDVIFAGIFVWGSAEFVVYTVDYLAKKGYLGE